MTVFPRFLIVAVVALMSALSPARAEVQTYEFSAAINLLFVFDGQTLNLAPAATAAGFSLAAGDVVTGRLTYDPEGSSLLSHTAVVQGSESIYASAGSQLQFQLSGSSLAYSSAGVSEVKVFNDSQSGGDGIQFSTMGGSSSIPGQLATFGFQDLNSAALTSDSLPQSLSAVQMPSISLNWTIYAGDGGFIAALIFPTSFQRVAAVPEPETWAMLLGGLGLVGAMARRRSLRA